ncbi:MAG: branched-chain amino acid ABC transporter permease [Candidatus Methanomethylicia archaeon]
MGFIRGKIGLDVLTLIITYAALISIPIFNDRFMLYLASLFMIYTLFSMAYNIMFGYAGLLSFGHSLFFATGAYGTAIFILRVFDDSIVGLLVGASLATGLALAVGLLTLRHGKIYFAMLTLAFTMLFYALLFKWRSFTGGSDGLAGISRRCFIGSMLQLEVFYYFIFIIFLVLMWTLYVLDRSNLGLIIKALGSNEERVEFSGHSIVRYRMISFLISGSISGVAGSLYALLIRVVTPDLAYWTTAAEPLIMTLLGGSGYFLGPLVGSLIFVAITTAVARIAEMWQLILGMVLISILLGFRGGIMGVISKVWGRL